jgi:heme/copper-type cytochrome/quinol oxidase subunit 4
MTFGVNPRTRKYLLGIASIWVLIGIEIGAFYAHAPRPALVPVCLVAAFCEWAIMTLLFLRLKEEAWGYSAVLYALLLLAVLVVGTLVLLMRVFFG